MPKSASRAIHADAHVIFQVTICICRAPPRAVARGRRPAAGGPAASVRARVSRPRRPASPGLLPAGRQAGRPAGRARQPPEPPDARVAASGSGFAGRPGGQGPVLVFIATRQCPVNLRYLSRKHLLQNLLAERLAGHFPYKGYSHGIAAELYRPEDAAARTPCPCCRASQSTHLT